MCPVHRPFAPLLAGWLGVCMFAASGHAQSPPAREAQSFSIAHYDVQLEPRLESRTVTGTATLSVVSHRDDVAPAGTTVALNRGRLEIDSVQEGGRGRAFVIDGNRLRITLPRVRANETRTLTVSYHGAPSSGLVFNAEREQVYTVFSTSQHPWSPSGPTKRASWPSRSKIRKYPRTADHGASPSIPDP